MGAMCVTKETPEQVEQKRNAQLKQQKEMENQRRIEKKFEEVKENLNQLELDKLSKTEHIIVEADMGKIMGVLDLGSEDPVVQNVLNRMHETNPNHDVEIIEDYKKMTKQQQYYIIEYLKIVQRLVELNKDLQDHRTKHWADVSIKYKIAESPAPVMVETAKN